MRERRAAHVRPLPPSGDRLRSNQIKASAPSRELVRRYRPVRTSKGVPPPLGIGVIAVFLVMGVADAMGPLSNAVKDKFQISSVMATLMPRLCTS